MILHAAECANWHCKTQEPNDTLQEKSAMALSAAMSGDFREALIWHMERFETPIAELVRATGVSRDVINKLRSRPDSSTTAENAMLIAAYYGKTVNAFITKEEATEEARLSALFSLLGPVERRLLEAQINGLLSSHDQR